MSTCLSFLLKFLSFCVSLEAYMIVNDKSDLLKGPPSWDITHIHSLNYLYLDLQTDKMC